MSVRGWCPSLAEPMPAADGLLVRLRPRFARLHADEALLVAQAAAVHGNGVIELTSRGNLQLRGFDAGSARAAAAMIGGLDQPALRPSLVVSPLLGVDPAAHKAGEALAGRLAAVLAALPAVSGPAEKCFMTLDAGGAAGLGAMGADIAVRAAGDDWLVRRDGDAEAVSCVTEEVPGLVDRWLRDWLASGTARVRDMRAGTKRRADGAVVTPGAVDGVVMVALPFGAIDAAGLRALAERAVRDGDGVLRLTPWRMVMLAGCAAGQVATPALVHACIGRAGCAAASTDTRDDARRLLGVLGDRGEVHVSGCAKGCAHPAAAALTLVGRDGLYDMVIGGKADDVPVARGLTLDAVMRSHARLVSA